MSLNDKIDKLASTLIDAELSNSEDSINRLKNGSKLSDLDMVSICRYIRLKYGKDFLKGLKSEFTLMQVINILKFYGVDKSKDRFDNGIKEDYNKLCFALSPKNETYDRAIDIIENYEYYDNALKLNVDNNMIVISSRDYPNGMKEGVTIKKEPYSAAYSINIYFITGDFVYDIGENVAEGGLQCSVIFRLINLPTKLDLINTIMSFSEIEKYGDKRLINTDLSQFYAYETANTYWSKNNYKNLTEYLNIRLSEPHTSTPSKTNK